MLAIIFELIIIYEIASGNWLMLVLIILFPFVFIAGQVLNGLFDGWLASHPAKIPDQTDRDRVHAEKVRRATERMREERIAKLLAWDPTMTAEEAWRVSDRYELMGRMGIALDPLTKRSARELLESVRADRARYQLGSAARTGRGTGH